MSEFTSCIYRGNVRHSRLRPKRHHLSYSVFSFLIDLDELPLLAKSLRLFSHNRFNVFSFRDSDYGPTDGSPLRPWIDAQLAAAGINNGGGPVRLLCYPRVLGYAFNPLSVYYCYRADGVLTAILYEVRNTFGERHCYLLTVEADHTGVVRQTCPKEFYVSPFIGMDMTYDFRITPPSDQVGVGIRETDGEGVLLTASFSGLKEPMNNRTLFYLFAAFPLVTFKIMAGIHWEALQLWLKKVPLVPKPAPPEQLVSLPSHSKTASD